MIRQYFFKDLVVTLLIRFKLILSVTLLAVLIFSSAGMLQVYMESSHEEYTQKQTLDYQQRVDQFNKLKDNKEADILARKAEIVRKQYYMDNCLRFQLNDMEVPKRYKITHIDTGYQVVPGMIYQPVDTTASILNIIRSLYYTEELCTILEDNFFSGVDHQFIRELYYVECNLDSSTYTITVIHPDSNQVANMLDVIDNYLMQKVRDVFPNFETTVLQEYSAFVKDDSYSIKQEECAKELKTLNDTVIEQEKELTALVPPEKPTTALMSIMKKGILFGLVGGTVAIIIVCAILVLCDMVRGHILTAADVKSTFELPIFADFTKNTKRKNMFAPLINDLQGNIVVQESETDSMKMIVERIIAMGVKDFAILNLFPADQERIDYHSIQGVEGLTVNVVGDILRDCEALHLAAECDKWVISVKKSNTRFVDVDECIRIAKEMNKQVIGAVLQ